jgi:hypothetical protein
MADAIGPSAMSIANMLILVVSMVAASVLAADIMPDFIVHIGRSSNSPGLLGDGIQGAAPRRDQKGGQGIV